MGRRVAHSLWGASLFSNLLSNVLPGPGTIYRNQRLDFHRPLYRGDTLTLSVTAIEKNLIGRALFCSIARFIISTNLALAIFFSPFNCFSSYSCLFGCCRAIPPGGDCCRCPRCSAVPAEPSSTKPSMGLASQSTGEPFDRSSQRHPVWPSLRSVASRPPAVPGGQPHSTGTLPAAPRLNGSLSTLIHINTVRIIPPYLDQSSGNATGC